MSELIAQTLSQASKGLAEGCFSAQELLDAVLDRIAATDPVVRAYARLMTEEARQAAKQADGEIQKGHWRGPLHGVPIAVKDVCYTRGTITEAGSRVMAGFVPRYDSTVVRRLRDAGAVLVGKTVTHEFAYGQNIPPTRNPWNEDMYPGGSSVGSGVATAVGSTFGAIGTDTGGSIRLPAAMNGIVGLKPTFGRVSRYGVVPLSTSLDHVGPLTRTVEDCALILQAIAGPDSSDPNSADQPVPDYRLNLDAGVRGVRIGVVRDYYFGADVTDDVMDLVSAAERDLRRLGAAIVPVVIPQLEKSVVIASTLLSVEASSYHRELLRKHLTKYEDGTRLMLEFGFLVPATHYATALRARRWLCGAVQTAFYVHRLDAMLAPTLPLAAIRLEESVGDFFGGVDGRANLSGLFSHTVPANLTGLPSLTVPCGLTGDGLPVGVQFMARPFNEPMLFRIGQAYETATPWHEARPRMS
jgi:aspartyl-tRNA(Asn)/glutamyl-tRNA(Gln) amidotransferase subunit A